MGLPISRREFVLATSSFASFTMVEPIRSIARTGRGGSIAPSFVDSTLQAQDAGLKMKPKVLVFDVNQTMLDLNALRPQFARVFGDGKALDEWFSLLLHYSLVVTVTDAYADFGALKRLRAAGFRMVTLTNSSPSAVKAQLQNAGLTQYFDESISVDSVRRFKPDLETYRSAAVHLGARPGELLLIAAHPWDVFGAMKAGWQAAFVARNGITPFPLGPKLAVNEPDMKAVADAILK